MNVEFTKNSEKFKGVAVLGNNNYNKMAMLKIYDKE